MEDDERNLRPMLFPTLGNNELYKLKQLIYKYLHLQIIEILNL